MEKDRPIVHAPKDAHGALAIAESVFARLVRVVGVATGGARMWEGFVAQARWVVVADVMDLTRTRSATATGSERQSKWKGFDHRKRGHAAGSRSLQRLVRWLPLFVRVVFISHFFCLSVFACSLGVAYHGGLLARESNNDQARMLLTG